MRLSSGSSPEILRPSCGRLVRPVVLPSSGSSPEMRRNSESEMRISAPEMSPEMRRASSSFSLVGSSLDSGGSGQAQAQTEAVKEAAAVEEEEEKAGGGGGGARGAEGGALERPVLRLGLGFGLARAGSWSPEHSDLTEYSGSDGRDF